MSVNKSNNTRCAKKVCAIGGATLDLIIAYEDMEMMTLENADAARNYLLLEEGSKIEVNELHYFSGGGATNAAVTFARQGLDVYLFCKIGNDSAGKMVIEDLQKHGLNTDHVYLSKTAGTSCSFVVPALSGDRTIFAYRGANATLLNKELPVDGIKGSDFVYVTSLSQESSARLPDIAAIAKENSVPVAVNPGISQLKGGASYLKEALKVGIDTLILNDDEAAQLMASLIDTDQKLANLIASASIKSSKKDKSAKDCKVNLIDEMIYFGDLSFSLRQFVRQILDYGVKQVVVTLGSKGVCVATSEQLYFHDTPKGIKVVNTLGAGDAFGSAFTRAWYTGANVETAISFGILNSSSVIAHADAKSGALTKDGLNKKLKGFHKATKTSLTKVKW
jgi:ribokinase